MHYSDVIVSVIILMLTLVFSLGFTYCHYGSVSYVPHSVVHYKCNQCAYCLPNNWGKLKIEVIGKYYCSWQSGEYINSFLFPRFQFLYFQYLYQLFAKAKFLIFGTFSSRDSIPQQLFRTPLQPKYQHCTTKPFTKQHAKIPCQPQSNKL